MKAEFVVQADQMAGQLTRVRVILIPETESDRTLLKLLPGWFFSDYGDRVIVDREKREKG